jgi:hypothetical protein
MHSTIHQSAAKAISLRRKSVVKSNRFLVGPAHHKLLPWICKKCYCRAPEKSNEGGFVSKWWGIFLAVSVLGLCGCQPGKDASLSLGKDGASLRELTPDERSLDFDELLILFKNYYGPYAYKENLLQLKIDQLAADLKAQSLLAKTDEEFAGDVMKFGAALKDGHVQISLEQTSSGTSRYLVPIVLTPVEGHVLVGDIAADLKAATGISIGDEVLEVDGKAPLDYLPMILKYRSFARDLSNLHNLIYVLARPSYMTDLVPTSNLVRLKVKTASGLLVIQDIPWNAEKYNTDLNHLVGNNSVLDLQVPYMDDFNSVIENHRGQMGQVDPIFVTAQTQARFKFVKVYPSDKARKKFAMADKEIPPLYAALYRYSGKTILLVRQASYAQTDFSGQVYMKAYQALFDDYQDLADVLVLDQTHNPGGSYCSEFYNLFAQDGDVQSVENVRADRKWVNELKVIFPSMGTGLPGSWDKRTLEAWGSTVEKAYDAGKTLADPIPLFTGSFYAQPMAGRWTKPMLVLIDELAGSCGDIFPMLVKANGHVKLFGQNTMGLGGNVEEVGILNNSRIHVRLTRGMFYPYRAGATPSVQDFVENNGVAADYPYSHTVQDFRAGYQNYVKTFSDRALEQIH